MTPLVAAHASSEVVGAQAGHDGGHALLCHRGGQRSIGGAHPHQRGKGLVMGGRQVEVVEVEDLVAIDPVRREAGLRKAVRRGGADELPHPRLRAGLEAHEEPSMISFCHCRLVP